MTHIGRGDDCMLGGIYENKGKKGGKYLLRFKNITRRSNDRGALEKMLNGLRYKCDEGSFDARDYQQDQPLGFTKLSEAYLEKKDKKRSYSHMARHIRDAQNFFGNQNVKTIGYGPIEDFFDSMDLADKTKANIKATLHAFFRWVEKREKVPCPEFPSIEYSLGWRKVTDKETQQRIIAKVREMTFDRNPKYWIFMLFHSTYTNTRPIELLNIKEEDIDLENGFVTIKHNKIPRQYKRIYLLKEDIDLIRTMPRGFPGMYFFRHPPDAPREYRDQQVKRRRLEKVWDAACEEIGLKGVTLYPGCRHTSVIALGEEFSPEEIKRDGTGHATDKAFSRYFQVQADKKREISARARGETQVININTSAKNSNSL